MLQFFALMLSIFERKIFAQDIDLNDFLFHDKK
jgi:hypothetical protein